MMRASQRKPFSIPDLINNMSLEEIESAPEPQYSSQHTTLPLLDAPGPYMQMWLAAIAAEKELPPIETLCLTEHVSSVRDNTDGTIITEIRE